MRIKRLLSVLLVCALSLGMVVQVQATSVSEAQKKDKDLKAQKEAAQEKKSALEAELSTILSEIEKTKTDIEAKQQEIAQKEDELMLAQIDENNQYESMKKRIKYMYENGDTQFIEILFESKSIGDFLNNAEYIEKISEYDRQMLIEFQEIVKMIEEQQKVLEEERKQLEELQASLAQQQDNLESLISAKSDEISKLEGDIAANLKVLNEALAEQERLRQEAANQNPNTGTNTGVAGPSITPSGSGRLSNPCPAAYISSEFGGRKSPGGIGSTNHKGRDYAAGSGTPIYAAASGTVTTVSWNVARGYYVMVNHGDLTTLYQHCSATYVSVGQKVSAGQNIAAVGSTGYSTGPHLHFEVWVGGTPVDPRYYL